MKNLEINTGWVNSSGYRYFGVMSWQTKQSIMNALVFVIVCAFTATLTLAGSPFVGTYSDPNHPDCARYVQEKMLGKLAVTGEDNKGGGGVSCANAPADQLEEWGPLPASANATDILVDFSSKGGPSDLPGKWDAENSRIVWEDGNFWQQLP